MKPTSSGGDRPGHQAMNASVRDTWEGHLSQTWGAQRVWNNWKLSRQRGRVAGGAEYAWRWEYVVFPNNECVPGERPLTSILEWSRCSLHTFLLGVICVNSWSTPVVLNRILLSLLPISRDIWHHLETFLVVTTRGRAGCYWQLVGRGRNAAKCPIYALDSTSTKNSSAPNVSNAAAEKPWSALNLCAKSLASEVPWWTVPEGGSGRWALVDGIWGHQPGAFGHVLR